MIQHNPVKGLYISITFHKSKKTLDLYKYGCLSVFRYSLL